MKYDFNELEITVPYDVHSQGLTPLEQPRTEKIHTHKKNLQLCRSQGKVICLNSRKHKKCYLLG